MYAETARLSGRADISFLGGRNVNLIGFGRKCTHKVRIVKIS